MQLAPGGELVDVAGILAIEKLIIDIAVTAVTLHGQTVAQIIGNRSAQYCAGGAGFIVGNRGFNVAFKYVGGII